MLSRITAYTYRHTHVRLWHRHLSITRGCSLKSKFFYENSDPHKQDQQEPQKQDKEDTEQDEQVSVVLPDYQVPKDELRSKVKEFYCHKNLPSIPSFVERMSIKSSDMEDLLLSKSYAAVDTYKEMAESNDTLPPIVGSVVQYRNPIDNQIGLGIVIQEALSKFNNSYNKLLVLSTNNVVEYVQAQHVTFHLHGMLDPDWIRSLLVIENRHDVSYYSREVLVNILLYLCRKAKEIQGVITGPKKLLDVVYAQQSNGVLISSKSIWQIAEAVPFDEIQKQRVDSTYFTQCCYFLGLHNSITSAYDKFLVPSMYPNLDTSNVMQGMSNNLTKMPQQYLLPFRLYKSITRFVDTLNSPRHFEDLNTFMSTFTSEQTGTNKRSLTDLHLHFKIWEGKEFSFVLDVIKYMVLYPRDELLRGLEKLDVFEEGASSDICMEFLKKVGIYNDNTDIHSSLNMWGKSDVIEKVSMTGTEDMKAKLNSNRAKNDLITNDLFKHLKEYRFGSTDVIYGIKVGSLDIGVSFQKVNSRNFYVNIHLPSLITTLLPKSKTFKQMADNSYKQQSSVFPNNTIPLFDKKVLQQFEFPEQFIEESDNKFKTVADLDLNPQKKKLTGKKPIPSLTFSFKYNSYEEHPFKDFSRKVEISLNDISNVPIKTLDLETLQKALVGKKTTVPFTLFRTESMEPTKLNNDDYHNLGMVYNILKPHFSVRNINGAVNIRIDESNDRAQFFINELDKLVSNMTGHYCKEHGLPMIKESQGILNDSSLPGQVTDEVLITHSNILLPNYHSSSFFHTLVSRDSEGNVSLPAYFIGKNYLSRPQLGVKDTKSLTDGLDHGYIPMLTPGDSFEVLLNHFQILSNLQKVFMAKLYMTEETDEYEAKQRFSYLKGYGYNINGPLPGHVLEKHLNNLQNARQLNTLTQTMTKHHKLKQFEMKLQQTPQQETQHFDCVVTDAGYDLPDSSYTIFKCFVKQLNIEAEILSIKDTTTTIGTSIKSDQVLLLDPVKHLCVFLESPAL